MNVHQTKHHIYYATRGVFIGMVGRYKIGSPNVPDNPLNVWYATNDETGMSYFDITKLWNVNLNWRERTFANGKLRMLYYINKH